MVLLSPPKPPLAPNPVQTLPTSASFSQFSLLSAHPFLLPHPALVTVMVTIVVADGPPSSTLALTVSV